ncbi:MAG TPA: hypothetical protein P5135_03390, partial [Gemmatimonadales bacterium]|nr:hypothetical protein [Gemmatimonadales bacterium]
ALAALAGTETLDQPQVFTDNQAAGSAVAVNATGPTYLVTGGPFGGTDTDGFGGNLRWVRLNWPGGTKTVTVSWTDTGGDIDWGIYVGGTLNLQAYKGTGANPEVLSVTLPAGVYDMAIADFGNHGPQPQLSIVIE